MATEFRYLFTPLKLGTITVRNRTLQTGHVKSWYDRQTVDGGVIECERSAYYYAERAKGGVGLITTGYHMVHPTSSGGPWTAAEAWRPETVPSYKLITDMVHEYGGHICLQISHRGYSGGDDFPDDYHVAWAPSAIWGFSGYVRCPKAMEHEDIKELLEYTRRCVAYARQGGFDAVEWHGAHGYLLHQFLSPISNKRTDEYGGSLENRMRLTLEVIDAMREEAGKDFTIGFRITADDFVDGGLTLEETKIACKTYADTGKLDWINVSQGGMPTGLPDMSGISIQGGMTGIHGVFVPNAAAIKQVVENIPVFCIGRIVDPVMAENIVANGHADMVGMTRALICDPELPNKAREGRLEDIRHCIGCYQGCIERISVNLPMTCIQNPAAGREKRFGIGTLKPAAVKKKVIVVGGGPAGLKAAEIAARRGHNVTLYEKDAELGGQLRLGAKTPMRPELNEPIRYLSTQVKKLGVKINTGVEATTEMILKQKPDAVVIATGSRPLKATWDPISTTVRAIPGVEQDNVVTIWDVLEGKKKVGQRVVVADDENHWRSLSVADYLAQQGKQVEIVTRAATPMAPMVHYQKMGAGDKVLLASRMLKTGMKATTGTLIKEISGDTLTVASIWAPEVERKITGIDTIVWAMGTQANDELYFALKGKVKELHRIGDALAPRYMEHAFFEGEMVGRQL